MPQEMIFYNACLVVLILLVTSLLAFSVLAWIQETKTQNQWWEEERKDRIAFHETELIPSVDRKRATVTSPAIRRQFVLRRD